MMLRGILDTVVPTAVQAIELAGVAIIALGCAITLAIFLITLARRDKSTDAIIRFRADLGRAILLGLEFLVAADIVHTVLVDLSLQNVAALAGIVAIRTLLSFSLETEIEGRWPWQRSEAQRDRTKS